MEYSFHEMYGVEYGNKLFRSVKDELLELFQEYKDKYLHALVDIRLSSGSNSNVTSTNGTLSRKPTS